MYIVFGMQHSIEIYMLHVYSICITAVMHACIAHTYVYIEYGVHMVRTYGINDMTPWYSKCLHIITTFCLIPLY